MPFPSKHFATLKNTQEMKEIGRKGGSVRSTRKRYAARIREMKRKAKIGKISQKEVDWFMERLENDEANIVELQNWLEEVKNGKDAQKPHYQIQLIQTAIQLHKAHFGEKQHIRTENLNINVETNTKEIVEHLRQFGLKNED